jgi:Domain of unknown function (DUF4394)/Bacterial pre-peptidase C-terminal domain
MTNNSGDKFSNAYNLKLKNGTLKLKDSVGQYSPLDFYQFRLTGRSTFACVLNGLSENADLTLYDSGRNKIADSDEDDEDAESIRQVLGAGIYFIRVNRVGGDTDYNLQFSTKKDAGDSFGKAFRVRSPQGRSKGNFSYSDSIGGDDDKFDFYRFQISSRSTFSSFLQGLRANADIELFNSSRKRIAFSSKGGSNSESFDKVLNAGVYFIKVLIKSSFTQYKLRYSFTSIRIDQGSNSTGTASPIDFGSGSKLFNDFVGTGDPDDYYKVNLATPSNLDLALNTASGDANLQLLASDGTTLLGSSSNTGRTADPLNVSLTAGTYYVRVFPAAANTVSTYSLNFKVDALNNFGLADNNSLVAFDTDKLDKAVSLAVTGLTAGETLRGIDFRPANGKLYGLSSTSKLYTIDLATGAAAAVSATPFSPALTGTNAGFDFNPVVDRLRVVTDADENLRLNPDTGLAVDADLVTAGTQLDTPLAYFAGDANFGANPSVTAAAYTNNFAGTASTTLYGIDTTLDRLVRQGSQDGVPTSPNGGSLFTIGALGVDLGATTGFDISTDLFGNLAYAASGSTVYSINLTTGAATSLGTVKAGTATINLIGLAIAA